MNALRCAVMLFFLAGVAATASAQSAALPAGAPIPSPILNAKKVFVGNGGTDLNAQATGNVFSQDLGTRAYENLYQGLQVWGRYQLVNNPADADLVFEIAVRSQGSERNLADNSLRFDLLILDGKTHFTLWRFVEGFDFLGLPKSSRERNFNRHMEHLLGLVKELAQGTKP